MVQDAKRFISYICPHCRQSVIVERSVFSIAASPVHIKCPCGKSELRAEMLGDRVELEVPCLFCGHEHRVSCSSKAFLYQKALAFSCAASGLDCCYVGEEGPVYAATARLEQAVDKLETESAQQGAFLDELVMQEVLSEIRDIAQRGGDFLCLRQQGVDLPGEFQFCGCHLQTVRGGDADSGCHCG